VVSRPLWLLGTAATAKSRADGTQLPADRPAKQGQRGDRNDSDEAQNQTVLSERLSFLVSVDGE
jgi:hypothetical protein